MRNYSDNLAPQAFLQAQKKLRRKRKYGVLKSIILIDSLLKLRLATEQNQYSKQIMHATKLVNKK